MLPAKPAPYTPAAMALDAVPVVSSMLLHAWMRGGVWWSLASSVFLALQLAGAAYVFAVLLKKEMQPPHWPGARPVAADNLTSTSPSVSPSPAPPSLPSTVPPRRKRKHVKYFDIVAAQPVNPFLHPCWKLTSQWERARISAMAVTLVPVRALATVSLLLMTALLLKVALVGVPVEHVLTRPMTRRRKALLSLIIRVCARLITSLGLGFIPGISVEVLNSSERQTDPRVAPIVVANHTSFTDPLLLFGEYFVSAVGAVDNLRAPIIGTICQAIQTITVDRRDERSRHQVVEEIKARAGWASLSDAEKEAQYGPGAAELEWPQVMLYPEGSTTNGVALISFKQGAFVAKKPVQPVLISYTHPYPYNRFHPAWVSAGPGILVLLLRLWSEPLNYASLRFLPVMSPLPSELPEDVDCAVYARRVRRQMAEELRVPVTEHSYEDVVLQEAALNVGRKKKKKPTAKQAAAEEGSVTHIPNSAVGDPSIKRQLTLASIPSDPDASPMAPPTPASALPLLTSLVEVSTLQRLFNCDLATLQAHLARFQRMDVRRQGRVSYDEFLRLFDVDPEVDAQEGAQSSMRHLFELLDEDESGELDFREFLVGLALLADAERDEVTSPQDNDATSSNARNNNSVSVAEARKRRGSLDPEEEAKLREAAHARHEATLRLAFDMFSSPAAAGGGSGGGASGDDGDCAGDVEVVRVSDLRRVFRRAFPDVADSAVERVFAQAEQAARQRHPELLCASPGGSSPDPQAVGLTWEEFREFCHEHPECVSKFKTTVLRPVAATTTSATGATTPVKPKGAD